MDARKQPILVETKTFILKEALVDSDGESVWFITDSQNKNISFCVHCQFSGSIYIFVPISIILSIDDFVTTQFTCSSFKNVPSLS